MRFGWAVLERIGGTDQQGLELLDPGMLPIHLSTRCSPSAAFRFPGALFRTLRCDSRSFWTFLGRVVERGDRSDNRNPSLLRGRGRRRGRGRFGIIGQGSAVYLGEQKGGQVN